MKKIDICILICLFASPSLLQAQSNATFIGIWRTGNTQQIMYPVTNNVNSIAQEAHESGYSHMSDLEIVAKDRQEYNWSVWEKPANASLPTTIDMMGNWQDTQSDMREYSNRHLSNIEAFYNVEAGQVYFHAIYESGAHQQEIHRASGWNNFVGIWENNSCRNMRLKSVETYIEDGKRYFVGIFQAGTHDNYLYKLTGWNSFTKKWNELAKKNYRLIDIETYVQEGRRYYIGVWEPGNGGYYLWQVRGHQNFENKFNELKGKMELVDLEVIF